MLLFQREFFFSNIQTVGQRQKLLGILVRLNFVILVQGQALELFERYFLEFFDLVALKLLDGLHQIILLPPNIYVRNMVNQLLAVSELAPVTFGQCLHPFQIELVRIFVLHLIQNFPILVREIFLNELSIVSGANVD